MFNNFGHPSQFNDILELPDVRSFFHRFDGRLNKSSGSVQVLLDSPYLNDKEGRPASEHKVSAFIS